MGRDTGRNLGARGVVSIDQADTPQFTMRVYAFKDTSRSRLIENTGQGSGNEQGQRAGIQEGVIVLNGEVQRAAYPMPTSLKNATGTLKLYFDFDPQNPLKKEMGIRIEEVIYSESEKDSQNWSMTILATRTSGYTLSNWPGTQANPSDPSPGTSYLYADRNKVVDAASGNSVIGRSLQVIDYWGAVSDDDAGDVAELALVAAAYTTPPQTGEKAYSYRLTRTDAFGGRVAIEWRLSNTTDEIEQSGTSASRAAVDPFLNSFRTKTSSTASADSIADSLYPSFLALQYAQSLRVRKLNPGVAQVDVRYVNPGILVMSSLLTHSRYVPARLDVDGSVYVFINTKLTRGTGRYQYGLSMQLVNDPVRSIIVQRAIWQNPPVPDYQSLAGTTNNNTFLGLAAGTVFYRGAKSRFQTQFATKLTFFMLYSFLDDPNGIFKLQGFNRRGLFESTANLSLGWNKVSDITGPTSITATVPSQSDFSPFVS